MPKLSRVSFVLAAAVLVAAALLAYLTPSRNGVALIGGPFALQTADGRMLTEKDMLGHPFLVYFGYTHCPDICPTDLAQISDMFAKLPGKPVKALFITVDPERDTPAVLARYAALFATPIVALTGTPAEIVAVTKSFGIYSKRVIQPGGGYTIDHTATALLFDRAGKFVATIAPDEGDTAALAKLRRIAN